MYKYIMFKSHLSVGTHYCKFPFKFFLTSEDFYFLLSLFSIYYTKNTTHTHTHILMTGWLMAAQVIVLIIS